MRRQQSRLSNSHAEAAVKARLSNSHAEAAVKAVKQSCGGSSQGCQTVMRRQQSRLSNSHAEAAVKAVKQSCGGSSQGCQTVMRRQQSRQDCQTVIRRQQSRLSNSHAEAAVKAVKWSCGGSSQGKTVKQLILKTTVDGKLDTDEFQLALLEERNTPRADGRSPSQVVYRRPMASDAFANHRTFSTEYQRKADEADHAAITARAHNQAYYNRSAHALAALKIGTMVEVQDNRSGRWTTTGTVVAIGQNRDYFVKLPSGHVYRRNRRFLRIHYPATPVAVSLMPHLREDDHQKRSRDEGHEKQKSQSEFAKIRSHSKASGTLWHCQF